VGVMPATFDPTLMSPEARTALPRLDACEHEFGGLDIRVNNAASSTSAPKSRTPAKKNGNSVVAVESKGRYGSE